MAQTVIDTNLRILDFLGLPRQCVEVDISLRINALPVVRVVSYVMPHQIKDDALVTEEKRFTLTLITEAETENPGAVAGVAGVGGG